MYTILFAAVLTLVLVLTFMTLKATGYCCRGFLYVFDGFMLSMDVLYQNMCASAFDVETSFSLGLALMMLLYMLSSILLRYRYLKPIIIVMDIIFTLVTLMPMLMKLVIGIPYFTADHMVVVMQTNLSETFGFIKAVIPWWGWLGVSMLLVGAAVISYYGRPLSMRPLKIYIIPVLFVAAALLSYNKCSAITTLKCNIESFVGRVQYLKRSADVDYGVFTSNGQSPDSLNLIIVIGESLCRDYMSAYGYDYDTTPKIDSLIARGELLRFDNAYSTHIYTNYCVPRMLTSESQVCDNIDYMLFPLLKRHGYYTSYISSNPSNDLHSNPVQVLSENADYRSFNDRQPAYDMDLVPVVQEVLDTPRPYKLVVAHMVGSHLPYNIRYPEEFGRIADINSSKDLSDYERSLLYTDAVIDSLMTVLSERHNTIMLFVPDHGEGPGKLRVTTGFDMRMARIPFLLYFSPDLRSTPRYQTLSKNVDKCWINDFTFNLVCSLVGLDCDGILSDQFDISSDQYVFTRSMLKILGRKAPPDER